MQWESGLTRKRYSFIINCLLILTSLCLFFITTGCSPSKPEHVEPGGIKTSGGPPVKTPGGTATASLAKSPVRSPSDIVSRDLLATAKRLYTERKYPEAIREAERVIRENPGSADAYGFIGKTLIELKQYEKARNYLKKALEMKPDLHYARIHLGESYFEAGDYDTALVTFRKVEEMDPSNVDAVLDIGEVYVQKKNYDLAEKYLKRAIELKPDYFSPYNEMGNLSYLRGDYRKAIEYHKKSLEKRDDYEDALIGLGLAYTALKEYDRAEKYLEKAIDINEDHCGEALSTMGDIKTARKKFADAEKYYLRAIETDKYDAQGYLGLGKLYLLMNEPGKAEDILQRSLKINPQTAFSKEIHYNLAIIYAGKKDRENTLKHLKLSAGKSGEWKKRIDGKKVFLFLKEQRKR